MECSGVDVEDLMDAAGQRLHYQPNGNVSFILDAVSDMLWRSEFISTYQYVIEMEDLRFLRKLVANKNSLYYTG